MLFKTIKAHLLLYHYRDLKCKDAVISLYDLIGGHLEMRPTGRNITYPGLPNRTTGKLFIYKKFDPLFFIKKVLEKSSFFDLIKKAKQRNSYIIYIQKLISIEIFETINFLFNSFSFNIFQKSFLIFYCFCYNFVHQNHQIVYYMQLASQSITSLLI